MKQGEIPINPDISFISLQNGFLAILPKIQLAGQVYFRNVRCHDKKQDAINEMVALSWKWYVRLSERGKDPSEFPTVLGEYAARAVNSGRRLCGQEKSKDAMSFVAQQRYGFAVEKLPALSSDVTSAFDEALLDNMQSPVFDQVCFRCDFPAWRTTRTDRDRRLMDDLMIGERTLDVSKKYGLSPARISQLRRDFHDDWERFCSVPTSPSTSHATVDCLRPGQPSGNAA